ncbi:hypothetical protein ACKAV7_003734 [Fusarium commune]
MFESDARQTGLPSHFEFPQNSIVWQNKKSTHDHQTAKPSGQREICLPCTYPTHTANCWRRNSNSTYPRAYPRPHISSESQPGDDKTGLPYTARISFRQCQIRQPGESTSRSIKSKLPTLDLPWTTLTLVCTGADIKLDQDKPAYPRPHTSHIIDRPALESILEPTMSKQPTLHRPAHSRTRSCQPDSTDSNKPNSTKSNSTTLHRPSGRHIEIPTTPTSLQKSGEPIGEIEAKDGLPSADRNNKATLLLTGPFRTAKSSAKDLTPLVLKLQYAKYHDALRAPWKNRLLRR